MSPREAHDLVGHAEPFTWRDGLAHMREVTPGALDITDHAEIDAIVAAYNKQFRPGLHRQQVVEIVRLVRERQVHGGRDGTSVENAGEGPFGPQGKSSSVENPPAVADAKPIGIQLIEHQDAINRVLAQAADPITAAQGERVVSLLTAMAADLHALRAMAAKMARRRRQMLRAKLKAEG